MSKIKLMERLQRGPQPDVDPEELDDGLTWVNEMPALTSMYSAEDGEYQVWWVLVLSTKLRVSRDVFPAVLFGHDAAYACAGNLIHNELLRTIDIVCVEAPDAVAALAHVNHYIQELNDRLIYKVEDADARKEEAKRRINRARAAMGQLA